MSHDAEAQHSDSHAGDTARMRAVVQDRYGDTDMLRQELVPRPEPGDGEVLVRPAAAPQAVRLTVRAEGQHQAERGDVHGGRRTSIAEERERHSGGVYRRRTP